MRRHSPTALNSDINATLGLLARVRRTAVGTESPPPHPELPRRASWPPAFPAAKPSRRLTQGPRQPPEPRIAHLDHHPVGIPNRNGQRTAALRYPLAGGVPTLTRATSRSRVVPLARSSPSPTLSSEFLAGIAPAAPPLGPKDDIAKPHKISRGFVQNRGYGCGLLRLSGAWLQKGFLLPFVFQLNLVNSV
jgi:hypothetical protein